MNCPNCGVSNLDNASICVNCSRSLAAGSAAQSYTPPPPPPNSFTGGGGPSPATGAQIPNYLWQSILTTICCCPPLGIVAIIFAAQVNSKLAAGDVAGARAASEKAKLFFWITLGLGVVFWIIGILMFGATLAQIYRDTLANS